MNLQLKSLGSLIRKNKKKLNFLKEDNLYAFFAFKIKKHKNQNYIFIFISSFILKLLSNKMKVRKAAAIDRF